MDEKAREDETRKDRPAANVSAQKKPSQNIWQGIKDRAVDIWLKVKQSSITDRALVVLTALYLGATLLMWQAMRESNEGSQRAWILIRESTPLVAEIDGRCPIYPADDPSAKHSIVSNLRQGVSYCLRLTFENTSQASPGTISLGIFGAAVSNIPEREFLRDPPYQPVTFQQRRSRTIVGAKHSHYVIVPQIAKGPDGKPLPTEVVDQINSGTEVNGRTMRLYVYGRLEYEDAFRKSRETTFCIVWVPKLGSFDTCEAYNEVK